MHRGGFIKGLFVAILLIAVIGGAAFFAYGAGIEVGRGGVVPPNALVAPATGVAPIAPYPYYGRFMHPFEFGFGALGCLLPLLFVFLFFGIGRMMFGRRHMMWKMHHGDGEGHGVPPMFEEWHKRAHEPAKE